MKNAMLVVLGLAAGFANGSLAAPAAPGSSTPQSQLFPDFTGLFATLSTNGPVDRHGTFFKSLGTNGRSCGSCHIPEEGASITPIGASLTFALSRGQDPLFASVDGANCPSARASDPVAHSLLLRNGLFRISIALPANAQFTITAVRDPYGCAITIDPKTGQEDISVYRRPLPATNLAFLSDVMIDGRESIASLGTESTYFPNLITDLKQQASDATTGHAQALQPPTDAQLTDIVNFELGLYSAQSLDWLAGALTQGGGLGGATLLANQPYYPGINDTKGDSSSGAPFNPASMSLFAAWAPAGATTPAIGRADAARSAIAAGETIFNSAPLITGAGGVTHCANCHDTPQIGNHSLSAMFDIGASHSPLPGTESSAQVSAALADLSLPDLPVYLISGCPDTTDPTQTESFYTTDPGRALITGKCSDVYKVKVPVLRDLAARAPYFHNGAAADLMQVVNFYNDRFQMGLTAQQKADLAAFLAAL